MVDTDISHETEKRLMDIEARLTALEGAAVSDGADTEDTSGDVLFDPGEDE